MKEYEIFDEYLKKSQKIKDYCEANEQLLFESIKMNIPADNKIQWLKAVGVELDKVLDFWDELTIERKSFQNIKR